MSDFENSPKIENYNLKFSVDYNAVFLTAVCHTLPLQSSEPMPQNFVVPLGVAAHTSTFLHKVSTEREQNVTKI